MPDPRDKIVNGYAVPDDEHFAAAGKREPFAQVPLWVIQSLSPGDLRVYTVLATFANGETRWTWPLTRTIAERAGLRPRTVEDTLARLVKAGAIVREPRLREDGTRAGSFFHLPMSRPRPGDPPAKVPAKGRGALRAGHGGVPRAEHGVGVRAEHGVMEQTTRN